MELRLKEQATFAARLRNIVPEKLEPITITFEGGITLRCFRNHLTTINEVTVIPDGSTNVMCQQCRTLNKDIVIIRKNAGVILP